MARQIAELGVAGHQLVANFGKFRRQGRQCAEIPPATGFLLSGLGWSPSGLVNQEDEALLVAGDLSAQRARECGGLNTTWHLGALLRANPFSTYTRSTKQSQRVTGLRSKLSSMENNYQDVLFLVANKGVYHIRVI